MIIQPTYVTFEQAVLLKQKAFNENCYTVIDIRKSMIINPFRCCNSELIKEAFSRPEQWLVIEWLRVVHNIFISCVVWQDAPHFHSRIYLLNEKESVEVGSFDSPQTAYSAAFDHILNSLI